MPREKEDFRVNLEQLNRLFPEREMLTVKETMQVMNYGSVSTARRHVRFRDGKVSKATLARIMCG